MHNQDLKSRFVELCAKGWSLARIGQKIGIASPTLGFWQHQYQNQIAYLRSRELATLEEQMCYEQWEPMARLEAVFNRLAAGPAERRLEIAAVDHPDRWATLLRQRLRQHGDPSLFTGPEAGSLPDCAGNPT